MKTEINPFIGTWSIVEMEAWDQEYVNMEVPGHFTFKKNGTGLFQLGLVQGEMDCRLDTDDKRARIEFSWEGQEELDSASGHNEYQWGDFKGNPNDLMRGMADDDDKEPIPMEGLGSLTAAQQALVKFLVGGEDCREIRTRGPDARSENSDLKTLAEDFPKAWKSVQQVVERGTGPAYDEACRALVDLSEAYSVHASRANFDQKLHKFMAGHLRRKAFIERLLKAGIWHEKYRRI